MPIVELENGELRDEIRQILYDTVVLEAAETLVSQPVRQFFTSIQSGGLSGGLKSLAETNMKQPSSLPTATSYMLRGMGIDASNVAVGNIGFLPLIQTKTALSLTIGEKIYWQGPTRFAGGRMEQNATSGTVAAQAPFVYQQYGWSAIQPLIWQGNHVVEINPLQTFKVDMITNAQDLTAAEAALAVATGTDLWITCSLKGDLRRPVQ